MKNIAVWMSLAVLSCLGCGGATPTGSGARQDPIVQSTTPSSPIGAGAAGAANVGVQTGIGLAAGSSANLMSSAQASGAAGWSSPVTGSAGQAAPLQPSAAGVSAPPVQSLAAGAPAVPTAGASANTGATGADDPAADSFCNDYGKYCGYGQPNRHADRAACLADFEATPAQKACKVMHLDTAIAGTAAACNGMQSAFCFSIHCLHAAGMADPTGMVYCK